MARWATVIGKRREEKHVLIVDVGGFCHPKQTTHQDLKDRYFFEGVRLIGYDAMGISEKEIRFGRSRLQRTAKEYELPLVSSNIFDKRSETHLARRYIIKHLGGRWSLFGRKGGLKVGIFSLTLPGFIYGIDVDAQQYYDVANPSAVALEMVSELRKKGCDLVIALCHLGWPKSYQLAESVPGIDIVINGHKSHWNTHYEMVGNTIVVDTGNKRTSFTEITANFEGGNVVLDARDAGKEALQAEEDPEIIVLERRFEKEKRIRETGGGG